MLLRSNLGKDAVICATDWRVVDVGFDTFSFAGLVKSSHIAYKATEKKWRHSWKGECEILYDTGKSVFLSKMGNLL